jgi:hypothetical protein
MAAILVADDTAIDSAGTDGLTIEISQVVPLNGANAVQMAILLFALTATNISLQLEVSLDGSNWAAKGSAQTLNAIGRKLFTVETAVAATFARIKYSLTGSGKAIFKSWLNISTQ